MSLRPGGSQSSRSPAFLPELIMMSMSNAKKVFGALILMAVVFIAWRVGRRPDCNCYFPNSRRFGVLAGAVGCEVRSCKVTDDFKERLKERETGKLNPTVQ
jgi:hypothetical protein